MTLMMSQPSCDPCTPFCSATNSLVKNVAGVWPCLSYSMKIGGHNIPTTEVEPRLRNPAVSQTQGTGTWGKAMLILQSLHGLGLFHQGADLFLPRSRAYHVDLVTWQWRQS